MLQHCHECNIATSDDGLVWSNANNSNTHICMTCCWMRAPSHGDTTHAQKYMSKLYQ
jgi:hypothetical protein